MAKKKMDLFEMTAVFDKEADCWKIDVELTPDGLAVLEHFLVRTGTKRYTTGKVLGETEGRLSEDLGTRYLCRMSFFGLNSVGLGPEDFLYLFDKPAIDAGSNIRTKWAVGFPQVRAHGEHLYGMFQKMTLESCIASKKYIVKCHAELEGE